MLELLSYLVIVGCSAYFIYRGIVTNLDYSIILTSLNITLYLYTSFHSLNIILRGSIIFTI